MSQHNRDSKENEASQFLSQRTQRLNLNPNATEWRPNMFAREFVPSWRPQNPVPAYGPPRHAPVYATAPAPVQTAPVSAAPALTAPAPAPAYHPQPIPAPASVPVQQATQRSLRLSSDSPKSAQLTDKRQDPTTPSKKADGQKSIAPTRPAAQAAKKKATVSASAAPPAVPPAAPAAAPPAAPATAPAASAAAKEGKGHKGEKAVKAEAVDVKAHIDAVDHEIVHDLYGKEHMNIVFMGHVDAGKSTMGGNILFLTGMVDKRTMEKYEKEAKEVGRDSWYLSWALDTNQEERAKGKTVECGRAYFETKKRRYTILDAPGHKNFVPSMITGAAQADVGVLVISARKGEFETGFERGGQTREHTMLAKTAGVNRLIVAVNKMDDPTVEWSKERYDEIVTKLGPFLKGTGYNPKNDVFFMPVSGFTGANIKDRVDKKVCKWYNGPSLLEYFDHMQTIGRKIDAPLMVPINEKYKDMGTIVVGKIESGKLEKNQSVMVMPNKRMCEVQAIYNEIDDEVAVALCGDNVRIRLRGIEEEETSSGFVLCDIKNPVKTTTSFDCQLAILEHRNIICPGYKAVLHVHTCVEDVTVAAFLHLIDKKTGRRSKQPPRFVKQGQKVICRLETSEPICVEPFDVYPQLGRFTLRDEGKTIAIGKITKVYEGESTN